jgi:hypothetical protein
MDNINNQPKTPKFWKLVRNAIQANKMSGQTLYVTSFDQKMYEMSGKLLIDTFTKLNPKYYLAICYEGMEFNTDNPQLLPYNMDESKFMNDWLKTNENDIPAEYGGKATKENNPELFANYFNRAASKWFRKIVAIDYGIKKYGQYFKYVVWLDADCYARAHLPESLVDAMFSKHDFMFHLSSKRISMDLGIESSILGFRNNMGYKFMDIVSDKFKDGSFKQYKRWDDGWVFREVVDEEVEKNKNRKPNEVIKFLDLVGNIDVKKMRKSEVVPYGPFRDYFVHEKGKHNKLRGAKVKKVNYNNV